jgi:hypothetical protein
VNKWKIKTNHVITRWLTASANPVGKRKPLDEKTSSGQ